MAKINFKPNEDRVLVEPAAAEQKTASGIIIPDTAKEKPQKGKVIAVGEGLKDKPVTVRLAIRFYMASIQAQRLPSMAKNTSSCAIPTFLEPFNFFIHN